MSVQHSEGKVISQDRIDTWAPASNGVDVKDVIGILSRRRGWIFGVTVALCALAGLYLVVARPAYTAISQVYVDPRDRPTPKEEPSSQNSVPGDGLLIVESQLKIITSNDVLTRVVDEMTLGTDPDFNGQNSLTTRLSALLGKARHVDAALTALRNLRLRTTAKRNDRSFVIDIAVSAGTPERAEQLTNAVANAYLEEEASANADFNRRLSDAITSKLDGMRSAVSQSEHAVAAYKADNNLVGARNRLVTEEELDQTNTQLTNAKARLNEVQARVKLIDSIAAGGTQLDALPEAIQSGTIAQLHARAADISREEAQLALTNGPNHPALQVVRAQLRDVNAAIKAQVRLIAQAVRNSETTEQTNVKNLQARFETLKTLSKNNDTIVVPLRELERKADSDRAVYETFLAKAKTASEQQVVDTTNIRLISRALLPEQKSWPPTIIVMAAALFGGLALGVLSALARESLGASKGAVLPVSGRPADRKIAGRPPIAVLPQ